MIQEQVDAAMSAKAEAALKAKLAADVAAREGHEALESKGAGLGAA